MSDAYFIYYTNINLYATKWRKFTSKSKLLSESEVKNAIYTSQDNMVKMEFINTETKKNILIFLISSNSKYYTSSQDLKKLLGKLDDAEVILITAEPYKIYGTKAIRAAKHITIKTYLHKNFLIEMPYGPLCYKHRIMSVEEVENLLNNELFCELQNLPSIYINDTQAIWIGAELYNVLEITYETELCLTSIDYRVVIPNENMIMELKEAAENANDEQDLEQELEPELEYIDELEGDDNSEEE